MFSSKTFHFRLSFQIPSRGIRLSEGVRVRVGEGEGEGRHFLSLSDSLISNLCLLQSLETMKFVVVVGGLEGF